MLLYPQRIVCISSLYLLLTWYSPCFAIFDQVLEHISKLKREEIPGFLEKIYHEQIPSPGNQLVVQPTIVVHEGQVPQAQEPARFTRPEDDLSLSGFTNFSVLLETLDPFSIASIMVSLLLERRVIFISSKLSILSNCVQAAAALLYPFVWQHVFIPVLPLAMIQFVCAPVPFLVGILASHVPELQAQSDAMEEVILVDLDASVIVPPSQDYKCVPMSLFAPLVGSIHDAKGDTKRRTLSTIHCSLTHSQADRPKSLLKPATD